MIIIGEDIFKVKIKEDLTGKTFGRLTVLKRASDKFKEKKNGRIEYYANWYCDCECGNKNVIIKDYYLRKGLAKSCGCLKYIGHPMDNNTYNLSGEYGIGYTANNEEFYFDLEDYEKIKNYCWHLNKYGYIIAYDRKSGRSSVNNAIQMQWLIMNYYDEDCDHVNNVIDHINGDRKDNRKDNLRFVDRTQNNMNRKIQKNNTSGTTGVYWNKQKNKWTSQIMKYGEVYYLGSFNNIEDAISARKAGEEKYFGEYSYDNSRGDAVMG